MTCEGLLRLVILNRITKTVFIHRLGEVGEDNERKAKILSKLHR